MTGKKRTQRKKAAKAAVAKQPQQPQTRPQPNLPKKVQHMHPHRLAPCAMDYARAMVDPWNGPVCGIPNYPALMTLKQRVWVKGVFEASSTTGFGFIVVNPNFASVNDLACVRASTSAYTASTITTSAGTGVVGPVSNASFAQAQLATTLQYRVVASGLKIRYIGTELNRGGQLVAFHDPFHQSLNGKTLSQLDAELQSERFRVNENWSYVLFRPVHDEDLEMKSDLPAEFAWFMAFAFQAPTPEIGGTFEYEFFTICEYAGTNARGMTPSHYDPVGFASVHAVTQMNKNLMPSQTHPQNKQRSILSDIGNYLTKAVTYVGDHWDSVAEVAAIGAGLLL
jgi:hypothetical protein